MLPEGPALLSTPVDPACVSDGSSLEGRSGGTAKRSTMRELGAPRSSRACDLQAQMVEFHPCFAHEVQSSGKILLSAF